MEKKKHITGDTCLSGCESGELRKENHFEILRLWALSNPTVDSPSRRYFVGSDSSLNDFQPKCWSSDIICSNFLALSVSPSLSIYLSTPSIDSIYLSRFVPPISKQIPFASGIIRPVLLAYPENKDTIERYRPPICSARKSVSRERL